MVSYPLSLPGPLTSATIRPVTIAGVARSPFTGSVQVQSHQGEYWAGEITFPAHSGPVTSRRINAWLTALRGPVGSFWLGDPMAPLPAVNRVVCSPTIGASAGTLARQIVTHGWVTDDAITVDTTLITADSTLITADTTPIALRAGDYIQIGQRLHQLLEDAPITDVSLGRADMTIWPALRAAVAPGQAVIYRYPVGKFMLSPSDTYGWASVGRVHQQVSSLTVIEDMRQ